MVHVVGTSVFIIWSLFLLAILAGGVPDIYSPHALHFGQSSQYQFLTTLWTIVVALNIILQSIFVLNGLMVIFRKIFGK